MFNCYYCRVKVKSKNGEFASGVVPFLCQPQTIFSIAYDKVVICEKTFTNKAL